MFLLTGNNTGRRQVSEIGVSGEEERDMALLSEKGREECGELPGGSGKGGFVLEKKGPRVRVGGTKGEEAF